MHLRSERRISCGLVAPRRPPAHPGDDRAGADCSCTRHAWTQRPPDGQTEPPAVQSPFPLMPRAEGEPAETCSSEKRPWAVKTPTKARKGLLLKGKVTKPRTSDVHGLLWGQQWPLNAPTGNLAAVTLKPFARQHGEYLRFLPTGVCCITV